MQPLTHEQSQQLGKAVMALSVVQILLFLVGVSKRSYAALAIPVFFAVAAISALGFWVGWTDEEQAVKSTRLRLVRRPFKKVNMKASMPYLASVWGMSAMT